MNSKNKNMLLMLCLFIIIVIIIDIMFNFSGVMMENFQSANNSSTQLPSSIISKMSGRVINITFMSNDPNNETIFIPSPTTPNKNIVINADGTLSEDVVRSSDVNQQWILKRINNVAEYQSALGTNANNGYNPSSSCVSYPFYIITSNSPSKKNPNYCLAYEPGRLFSRPIGNYDNQKWDISNQKLNGKSICTHNTSGSLRSNPDTSDGQSVDADKIKIKLNVNDELLRQMLGNSSQNSSSSSETCDTYLPKNSIKSICKGCDVDK